MEMEKERKRKNRDGWALAVLFALLFTSGVAAQDLEPGHVRIRASLEPERVMVGQRAELTVEVMTRTWFLGAPSYPDTLEVADAVVLRPDTFGSNFSERIDGQTYAGQARRFAIFPIAPGVLTVPPVAVTLVVARDDASRSDPVTLTAEPLQLVAEVPRAARGLGLVPATPRLTVTQKWTPRTGGPWTVGDAITRTVSQHIAASVAMVLPAMTSTAPEGVAAYAERPAFANESDRGALSGSRTDAVTYVFEREGSYELPEVVIHWWDLEGDRLRTETLPGLTVEVAANPNLAPEHLRAPEDEVVEESAGGPPRRISGWREVLGVIAVLAGLWTARRRLAAGLGRIGRLLKSVPSAERPAWRALQRAIATADAPTVLSELYRWLDEARGEAGGTWREATRSTAVDSVEALEALELAAIRGEGVWSRSATRRVLRALRRRLLRGGSRPIFELAMLNPASSKSGRWDGV